MQFLVPITSQCFSFSSKVVFSDTGFINLRSFSNLISFLLLLSPKHKIQKQKQLKVEGKYVLLYTYPEFIKNFERIQVKRSVNLYLNGYHRTWKFIVTLIRLQLVIFDVSYFMKNNRSTYFVSFINPLNVS